MKKHLSVWQAACIITGYGVGRRYYDASIPCEPHRHSLGAGSSGRRVFLCLRHAYDAGRADDRQRRRDADRLRFQQVSFPGQSREGSARRLFRRFGACDDYESCRLHIRRLGGFGGLRMSPLAAKLVFYIVSAAIVFFGLKILGISESISVSVIIGIVLVLAAASLFHLKNPLVLISGGVSQALAFFGWPCSPL